MAKKASIKNHPLAHLVPDKWFGDDYVGRSFFGLTDFQVFERARADRQNILLEGPTGSAKTSFVYAVGAKYGLPVVNVACSQSMDVRTVIGSWHPNPHGGFHFVPGTALLAAVLGGIIYFDEVNAMNGRATAFFHGTLDKRRIVTVPEAAGSGWCSSCGHFNPAGSPDDYECDSCGEAISSTQVRCHKDMIVVGAYNPGYTDMYELNPAFRNRFDYPLCFDYSKNVEEELGIGKHLADLAEQLRHRCSEGLMTTPVSTNLLMSLVYMANDVSWEFAEGMFIARFNPEDRAAVSEALDQRRHLLIKEITEDEDEEDDDNGNDPDDSAQTIGAPRGKYQRQSSDPSKSYAAWADLFANPQGWKDMRAVKAKKPGSRLPDFKRVSDTFSLWIDSKIVPMPSVFRNRIDELHGKVPMAL